MTTRPTVERLDAIRFRKQNDPEVHDLFAEIDALQAERDRSEKNYLSAVNGRKEFRQAYKDMRAYAEKLRNLLSKIRGQWIHSVHATECLKALAEADEKTAGGGDE